MLHRSLAWLSVLVLVVASGCEGYSLNTVDDDPPDPPGDDDDDDDDSVEELYPDISLHPPEVRFGDVVELCSESRTFYIANEGEADLEVDEVAVVDDQGGIWDLPGVGSFTLAPGERSEDFPLLLHGLTLGPVDGELLVLSNDPDKGESTIALLGDVIELDGGHEQFEQGGATPVDILWVIDNSGSMDGELNNVANNFVSFMNAFVALDLDFQMGAITTDMDNIAQAGRLQGDPLFITDSDPTSVNAFLNTVSFGDGGSGSERGADAIQAALTEPLVSTDNAGFLRPDAQLSVIVISDEDDDSDVADVTFLNWFRGLKGPGNEDMVQITAIAGPMPLGCNDFWTTWGDPITATAAPRYDNFVTTTGGIFASICEEDYAASLESVGMRAAGLAVRFELTGRPSNPTTIEVQVDGVVVPRTTINGWVFDPVENAVIFNGDSVPGSGAIIDVFYDGGTPCDDG